MKLPPNWRSPYVLHALRVALVCTVIIGAAYVCLVVAFDVIDHHRLYGEVDTRLTQRLDQSAVNLAQAAANNTYDNAHDVDNAPVFLWKVATSGPPVSLTPGAPTLPRADVAAIAPVSVAVLGTQSFRLHSREINGERVVAGQSLAEADHVEEVLVDLEYLAGPVLLIGVLLGTLLIGIKAARPVELARRRQLEFTADASHELRTPLSVIEAEVSLALGTTRTTGEYRDTLGRVSRESTRLRDIVEDLLWLSRFDSEPPPPGSEPVDVSAIAAVCADRFEAVALGRGVQLSVVSEGDVQPWVSAPPEWIDRLVGVLVDNACRYAGRDGNVRITVWSRGNRVRLIVDDDGPGIPVDARAHLFDRFHRATEEGNGAGLGLAIGDAVVRGTGGEWRVETSPLGGARMEVRWHRSSGNKERIDRDVRTRAERPRDSDQLVPR